MRHIGHRQGGGRPGPRRQGSGGSLTTGAVVAFRDSQGRVRGRSDVAPAKVATPTSVICMRF